MQIGKPEGSSVLVEDECPCQVTMLGIGAKGRKRKGKITEEYEDRKRRREYGGRIWEHEKREE